MTYVSSLLINQLQAPENKSYFKQGRIRSKQASKNQSFVVGWGETFLEVIAVDIRSIVFA